MEPKQGLVQALGEALYGKDYAVVEEKPKPDRNKVSEIAGSLAATVLAVCVMVLLIAGTVKLIMTWF